MVCFLVVLSSITPYSHGGTCIKTFNRYAFLPVNNTANKNITPLEPWLEELNLSAYRELGPLEINAIRYGDQGEEIWITAYDSCDGCYDLADIEDYVFLVVNVEKNKITTVPANIINTSVVASDLYIREDDSIWARNEWKITYYGDNANWEYEILGEQKDYQTIPVLSRFNEENREFEFVEETVGIPSYWMQFGYPYMTKVVLDEDGVFWFFAHYDGIYSYNPDNREVHRHIDLPMKVLRVVFGSDEKFYFEEATANMLPRLNKRRIYTFVPDTNNISVFSTPDENWPGSISFLLDRNGNFWVDLVAMKDQNGIWYRIYPYPILYEIGIRWNSVEWVSHPPIVLESSNGYLWMSDYYRGRAWYDPESGTGCWFTTYDGNIIEDQEQRLWIVDSSLYSLSLDDLEE